MTTTVELLTCPSGDWEILLVNGEYFTSGHAVCVHDWLNVMRLLGHDVVERTISDEKMEVEDYK